MVISGNSSASIVQHLDLLILWSYSHVSICVLALMLIMEPLPADILLMDQPQVRKTKIIYQEDINVFLGLVLQNMQPGRRESFLYRYSIPINIIGNIIIFLLSDLILNLKCLPNQFPGTLQLPVTSVGKYQDQFQSSWPKILW